MTPLEDLKKQIKDNQMVVFAGTGISRAASGNHSAADWRGLLKDGIARCEALYSRTIRPNWGDHARADAESTDLDDMLSVAQKIERKLGGPKGGEFKKWLRETVGSLPLADDQVPKALQALNAPLYTTNYDGLLSQATGLHSLTWRDAADVERVLKGEDKAVVHLHGHWNAPESVIFSILSYARIRGDEFAQQLLRSLRTYKSVLFVGYGDGLSDPNFGPWMTWTSEVFSSSEYRSYRLALDKDVNRIQALHPADQRVHVLSYGDKHQDLAPFLHSLR